MFCKCRNSQKTEELSVAFLLGEAVRQYTDIVVDKMKAKDEEIERLKQQLSSMKSI